MALIPRGYKRTQAWNPGPYGQNFDIVWAGDKAGSGGGGSSSYSAPDINIPGFGSGGSGGSGDGGFNLPQYNAPGRDDARLEELRAKALNPALRGLRNNLQSGMIQGRISDNPFAESRRQGMLQAGMGQGLERAMTGAHNTAQSQYAPEFQAANQKAAAEYQAGVGRAGQMYAGGLQRGNLQFQAQTNATMAKANMEHQARMAQLNADLRSQYQT